MRYRSLRKRLIDTLRTAINRYDGNLPEPKPLTVVADCADQSGNDGKPMERLTDNLKYVKGPLPGQTTLTGQSWSNIYMADQDGGHRQCVPSAVNRAINRAAAGRQSTDRVVDMINSKSESLEKLDQTIRSMSEYRRSHQEPRECKTNVNRETCYATSYPNTKLQKCYWKPDAGKGFTGNLCEELNYKKDTMRYLDDHDVKARQQGAKVKFDAKEFEVEKKPGSKIPPNKYLPSMVHARRRRDPTISAPDPANPPEPLIRASDLSGRYYVPFKEINRPPGTQAMVEMELAEVEDAHKYNADPEDDEFGRSVPDTSAKLEYISKVLEGGGGHSPDTFESGELVTLDDNSNVQALRNYVVNMNVINKQLGKQTVDHEFDRKTVFLVEHKTDSKGFNLYYVKNETSDLFSINVGEKEKENIMLNPAKRKQIGQNKAQKGLYKIIGKSKKRFVATKNFANVVTGIMENLGSQNTHNPTNKMNWLLKKYEEAKRQKEEAQKQAQKQQNQSTKTEEAQPDANGNVDQYEVYECKKTVEEIELSDLVDAATQQKSSDEQKETQEAKEAAANAKAEQEAKAAAAKAKAEKEAKEAAAKAKKEAKEAAAKAEKEAQEAAESAEQEEAAANAKAEQEAKAAAAKAKAEKEAKEAAAKAEKEAKEAAEAAEAAKTIKQKTALLNKQIEENKQLKITIAAWKSKHSKLIMDRKNYTNQLKEKNTKLQAQIKALQASKSSGANITKLNEKIEAQQAELDEQKKLSDNLQRAVKEVATENEQLTEKLDAAKQAIEELSKKASPGKKTASFLSKLTAPIKKVYRKSTAAISNVSTMATLNSINKKVNALSRNHKNHLDKIKAQHDSFKGELKKEHEENLKALSTMHTAFEGKVQMQLETLQTEIQKEISKIKVSSSTAPTATKLSFKEYLEAKDLEPLPAVSSVSAEAMNTKKKLEAEKYELKLKDVQTLWNASSKIIERSNLYDENTQQNLVAKIIPKYLKKLYEKNGSNTKGLDKVVRKHADMLDTLQSRADAISLIAAQINAFITDLAEVQLWLPTNGTFIDNVHHTKAYIQNEFLAENIKDDLNVNTISDLRKEWRES